MQSRQRTSSRGTRTRRLWREIEALKKDMTIVLTTHYMEEAQALADRILTMKR